MRRVCGECGKRPAKFRYRKWVRADDDHWLCFQCWRALRQSNQEGLTMADLKEPEHLHGTAVPSEEPQSVKQLYEWAKKKFAELEKKLAKAPRAETQSAGDKSKN